MMRDKRLLAELSSSKKFIALNVIFQWVKLLANITIMFQIGFLIEALVLNDPYLSLTTPLIICAAMILVRFTATILANRMAFHSIADVKLSLRQRLYAKLLKLGNHYQQHIPTSEVVHIAGEGIEQLETYIGRYMPQLYYSLLAPLTLFIAISQFSFKTGLVLIIAVPLIPLSIIAFNKIAKRIMKKYWGKYTKLGDDFLENLQGLTTLKIYEADAIKHKQMNENAEAFRIATMRLLTMQLNSIVIMNIIAFGGASLAILMAVTEFSKGHISLAQGFIIIMLGAEFFIPLRLLGSYFHVAMNGTTACEKLFRILDLDFPQEVNSNALKNDTQDLAIHLKNISFQYQSESPVLSHFSMAIPHQCFTAIVGQSGCGKSTIASLLMGFQTQQEGDIYINGLSTKALSSQEWMQQVTLITHEAFVFKGSIRENLRIGKPNASDQELYDVLDLVQLKDFILAEGGLDYTILEQGSNLSGGQRQRLSIARALLHSSDIYIFDEATSNIDVESENAIMAVVHQLAKEKTVLFISHRLSHVLHADHIIVFEKPGKYLAGNHQWLFEHSSTYHQLYQKQTALEHYGRSESSIAS